MGGITKHVERGAMLSLSLSLSLSIPLKQTNPGSRDDFLRGYDEFPAMVLHTRMGISACSLRVSSFLRSLLLLPI